MGRYDQKLQMLEQLEKTCRVCTMCELGFVDAVRNGESHNPHVLSNLNPERFMVVGQNPGWNEVRQGLPFVGDAGARFDAEIAKHGLSRNDFYIANTVRCFTPGNTRPTAHHIKRCEPFLQMEINLIKPHIIIALGGVAFECLCPNSTFSECLGLLSPSKYGPSVFAIYHPSPLNLSDRDRLVAFQKQIRVMCGLVKALQLKCG